MSADLLPCPFCGGEAELVTKKARSQLTHYRYRCSRCHAAIGRWSGGIDGAAEEWNIRYKFHNGKFWKEAKSTYLKMEPGNTNLWRCMHCNRCFESVYKPLYSYCPNCGCKVVNE